MSRDWVAASICPIEGCPSDTADVEIIKDGNFMVGAAFTCVICGNMTVEHYDFKNKDKDEKDR